VSETTKRPTNELTNRKTKMSRGPPGLFFDGGPVYWKNEISGKMKAIVVKFLDKQPFNEWELETFRWYIKQWIEAMPSRPSDFLKVMLMSQNELFGYLSGELLEYGIDPL
jgi:hypothetical protein